MLAPFFPFTCLEVPAVDCESNYYALVDDVRLLTADLDATSPVLTDDQYVKLLRLYNGDTRRSAARALRIMAASEVLISKVIKTQDLSTDGRAVSAELRALAEQLDAEAEAEEAANGGSYASYIPPGCTGYGLEGVEARGTSYF